MGRIARGVGNNDVDAVPAYSLVYNGSKWHTGDEVDVYECLIIMIMIIITIIIILIIIT